MQKQKKLGHHVGQVQFKMFLARFAVLFFPPPPPNEFRAWGKV